MKDNRTPRSNQTKDARPRRLNSARLRMFAVVLTVFVVAGLMIALSISEPAHDLEIGAYLTEDVYATRDIYDEEATNLMRLEASAEVDRVYNLDTEIYTSLDHIITDNKTEVFHTRKQVINIPFLLIENRHKLLIRPVAENLLCNRGLIGLAFHTLQALYNSLQLLVNWQRHKVFIAYAELLQCKQRVALTSRQFVGKSS